MPDVRSSEKRLHRHWKFSRDLADILRKDASRAEEIGENLSDAVDLLLRSPRPYPLPITLFDERKAIWEYAFYPGYSFTYFAIDQPDGPDGSEERHYYLLRLKEV